MTKHIDSPLNDLLAAKFGLVALQAETENIKAIKTAAFETFKTLGFPSTKNEEWKNTNVLSLVKASYDIIGGTATTKYSNADIATQIEAHKTAIFTQEELHTDTYTLAIVNGEINWELSNLPTDDFITIKSFSEVLDNTSFNKYFNNVVVLENHAFAALNTAMFQNGLFIEIASNKAIDKPIHVVKIADTTQATIAFPRSLYVVNKSAQLDVIETYLNLNNAAPLFLNGVTEVYVAENAFFNHYDIQKTESNIQIIQRTEAAQESNSNYSNYTFTVPGADFVRNNLTLHLNDQNIESHLYGLYLTAGTQLVDNHSEVHHKMPHCESNQLYKGVLFDKSRGVFNGKIYVYQDAQKTNAFQQSNNVLFSDTATVNAKPQLEIFADDVKCSHGTTIGQINKDAIFYLQSRGIGEVSAKKMMVNAFAFDVTAKIKIDTLRIYLEHVISDAMDELTK